MEYTVLFAILLSYGWATYERNFIWKDEFTLCLDIIKKSPNKARPYIRVGLVYQRKGLIDEAISQYDKALSLNPNGRDAADAHNNLGLCYFDKGQVEMAILEFSRAIYIYPNYVPAHYNLGFIYIQQKDYKKALNEFKAIQRVDPNNEMARSLVHMLGQ
jgi:tetratricopeptide (TPR) repeat protein